MRGVVWHCQAYTLLMNLRSLLAEAQHMISLLKSENTAWMTKNQGTLMIIPFYLSLLIVFCLVIFYGTDTNPWAILPIMELFTVVICAFHLAATLVQFICYFIIEAPTLVPQNFEKQTDDESGSHKIEEERKYKRWPFSRPYMSFLAPVPTAPYLEYSATKVLRYVATGQSAEPLYYVFMLALSIIGLQMPFVHSLVLLEFFRTDAGRMVMKACIIGAPKLLNTFLLGVIMIMVWMSISFMYYYEAMNRVEYCVTVWQCTLRSLQAPNTP